MHYLNIDIIKISDDQY